jgi:hypothetical protein
LRHTPFTALPLVFLCFGTAARAQDSGSASSEFQRGRFHYDLEFLASGTGAGTQRTKVFMLLSRGQPDSLQPTVDTAITKREKRALDSAAMVAVRRSRNSIGVPMGGHWYGVEYTRDSVFVLGHAFALLGRDSVLVIMVDRGDRIGGDQVLAGTATLGAVPRGYWGLATNPQKQTPLLLGWLRRSPAARAFLE